MSFRSKAILAVPSVVHLIRRIRFSPFIVKYTISNVAHDVLELESESHKKYGLRIPAELNLE